MTLFPLVRQRTHTLLGIRFWDQVTQQPVTEGLIVTAQRLSSDRTQRLGRPVTGQATPSGAIAFFGLSPAERSRETDPQLWDAPPASELVVVDVTDGRSQFLPLSFVAQLPFRGVFRGQGDWLSTDLLRPEPLPNEALGVQLWSAPARLAPPGRAIVRAQLVVGETTAPAAYALLRVQTFPPDIDSTFDTFGMADDQGRVVLPISYPRVPEPPSAAIPYPPLEKQTFPLQITVQYRSDSFTSHRLPGSPVPNLEALLTQPAANIGDRWSPGPPRSLRSRPELSVDLRFGQPLILRTALDPEANAEQESVLRILPS
jgi:hypothetical protein